VKTHKWLGATGAVLALSAAGFVAAPAAQGTITIVPGSGSSVSCDIAGTAKLSPALANDWPKASHQADPGDASATGAVVSKDAATYTGNATITAAIASIPDSNYSAGSVAVTTSAKVASISCSGTVTDGTHSDTMLSAAIGSSSISAGTSEATCGGLASPGTSLFTSIVKWKTNGGAKVADSTVTSSLATLTDAHGVGFELDADGTGGTSITGSFSGGSSTSKAYVDGTTFGAITGSGSNGKSTTAANSTSPCEPTINGKFTPAASGVSDAVGIKLKKPKGFKLITLGPGLFDSSPSNLAISK